METEVREHFDRVTVVTLIHRGLVVRVVSLGVILVSRRLCLDLGLLLAAQQLVQTLDVAHSLTQNMDLEHLLHGYKISDAALGAALSASS